MIEIRNRNIRLNLKAADGHGVIGFEGSEGCSAPTTTSFVFVGFSNLVLV